MSNYTIELKDVVENHNIFNFNYPFYDESKRAEFEKAFIRHFYFREICCPTIDRFMVYLEDKMNTVFPYYNELFKSASIEYDILDNYKLTETYTRNVENNQKQSGVSSSVGKVIDEQKTETDENISVDSIGNDTERDTTTSTANKTETINSKSTTNTNVENNGTVNNTGDTIKKFLDTPQGLTNLEDSKYLTSLNHDTTNGTQESVGTQKTVSDGTTETTTNENSTANSTRNGTKNSQSNTDTVGKETTVQNGEQRSVSDNNTRLYSNGEQSETYTLTRRGNIGVDTDSDAIEKHNRLQKTLKNIERLFFEECEDLFMLVY